MPPKFIFFDLGNVLLCFDRQRQYRQMASLFDVSAEQIGQIVEQHDLINRNETGQLSAHEVYKIFCTSLHRDCDFADLQLAGNDIFWLNTSVLPLIVGLVGCRHRLGILSNTSASHWEFCTDRFALLGSCFERAVLSYQAGSMKPSAEIYAAAATSAGVAPNEIFYVDDLQANVDGAIAFGFDAVLYTTTAALADDLRQRGIRSNY